MAMLHRTIVFSLVVLLLSACASTRETAGPVTSRNVLTREQIEKANATSAYDAVMLLRSSWLRMRGVSRLPSESGSGQIQEHAILAYLDDQRLGTVEALRGIEVAAIQYIRHYPPAEAAARWGFNHGGGAIYVSTRPLSP